MASFQTNALGIGKFQFNPNKNQAYVIEVNHLNKAFEFKINDIKPKGISIHVNNSSKNLAIQLKTNENTLKNIKGKSFKLTIHNGKASKGTPVIFEGKSLLKIVDHEELFPGINILTLFDENDRPVLERMFFHHKGVNFINSGTATTTKFKDST